MKIAPFVTWWDSKLAAPWEMVNPGEEQSSSLDE